MRAWRPLQTPCLFSTLQCSLLTNKMRVLALLALLQISATPRTAGKSHGVIHDAMLEGVSFQDYSHSDGEDTPIEAGALLLEPASLAFGARPLGAAHAERVTLVNKSNYTLRLASISGSTHNFHASFFESKVVPPQGNTSFSVVFLGRREGQVDTHLFLHTSLGTHKYAVSGVAVMSEYRLSPLVGVKLPRNASFSPTIYMHNPHSHPIQIMEVYSSGGGVSLELPDGGVEGPQSLWFLPAHTTRAVVRVHYTPPVHQHTTHTAYIRIKLNGTGPVLVVPVEVGVERDAGPYVRPHAIDAGLGGTGDPPTQIKLEVGNSGNSWVLWRGAGLWGGEAACESHGAPGAAVDIALLQHSLPPFSPPRHIATLTVYWDRIYVSGACYGEVHLTTADHCLTVPYHAHALPGTLHFNATSLSFVTSTHDVMMAKEFVVRNDFAQAVHIADIQLTDTVRKYFAMTGFTVRSIPPGDSATVFSLRLREFNASLSLSCSITLVTNVTNYKVDVLLYSGRVDVVWSWPNWKGDHIDMGTVALSSTTTVRGTVVNNNPVAICTMAVGADMEGVSLQFLCLRQKDIVAPCSCLEAGGHGFLGLSAIAPARETTLRGRIWLQTNHAKVQVSLSLRAAKGKLIAKPLFLTNCFPGTSCSDRVRLESSLGFRMTLLNMTAEPKDIRLYHHVVDGKDTRDIQPHSANAHGRLYFTAHLTCRPFCYTSIIFNTTAHIDSWLAKPQSEEDWLASDVGALNTYMGIFANLTKGHPVHNFTLRMHTSEVYNQLVTASVQWAWPRLWAAEQMASAGLVGVGGTYTFNVTVHNPSRIENLYIQPVLAGNNLRKVPAPLRGGECDRPGCTWTPQAFTVVAIHPVGYDEEKRREPARVFRVGAAHGIVLPPNEFARIEIMFTPIAAAPHSSILFLRNNLTILEAVRVAGQGAFPSFKFGNRKPGVGTPLLFELTEKHLKDCEKERTRLSAPPNLTVKRSFTARNTGDIPITISTFYINGFECEGYGFKVLNCAGFELMPNATHKVDIAFTPDFTLSKIKRTLILVSSLVTAVNYSLVTTVPAHLLAPCSMALSRPPWETYVRNVVVSLMICIGLCVLAAGFMESDRILKIAEAVKAKNSIVHPALDLRNIGSKQWDDRRLSDDATKLSKYEEVVPPKNKKKLSKKYSSEPVTTDLPPEREKEKNEEWREKDVSEIPQDNKSEDGDNSTPPSETRETEKLLPETQSERKILDLPKKILTSLAEPKKRHTKTERRSTRCDEDASSTATESSNNDEPEKEIEPPQRASVERTAAKKSSPANSKKKCPAQYKDSYEGDGEDEEYDRPSKSNAAQSSYPGLLKFQRNKDSNTPTPTRQSKTAGVQNTTEPVVEKTKTEIKPEAQPQESVHQPKSKAVTNKFPNNKKDKVVKKKTDKVYPFTVRTDVAPSNQLQRISPPVVAAPTSRWGENRATFSDVVARSDSQPSTFSTVIAPKKPEPKVEKAKESPPGKHLFERKKEKVPLGPIGSNYFQKRSPTRAEEIESSLYSHPVRQITDPAVPKTLEELVSADNNNSFFYFGNENVRSPEIVPPREVGVIGKPTISSAYPTPIGQTFGQMRYSPSAMEDYGLEGARMMNEQAYDNGWEQGTNSPGLIAPNTTSQPNVYSRSVYSGDAGANYNGLWDMPTTTANSAIPAVHPNIAEDKSAAQWLWGFNGIRPPPGFPPTQQPIARPFDPFQSMSSIWSPGTLDHWSNGRKDDDNQQQ